MEDRREARSDGDRMASSSMTRRCVSDGNSVKAACPARARPPPKPRFFPGERSLVGMGEFWTAREVAGSGPLSVMTAARGRRVWEAREERRRERRVERKRVAMRATMEGVFPTIR